MRILVIVFMGVYLLAWFFTVLLLWQVGWIIKLLPVTTQFSNNVSIIFMAFAPLATLVLGYIAIETILENRKLFNKERYIQRIIERVEEVQEWILEICSLASSASPPGDPQERRNRKWRAERIAFLKNSIKVEAKKLDSRFTSEENLENVINELSDIIEEHKSNPDELAGVKSGESISEQIIDKANKALGIISNIKDKLQL